jgi:general secretion pathway protein G
MQLKRARRAFTLVELMVVVAIIGMLAAVVTINLVGQTDKARISRVKADFKVIGDAIDLFKVDCGFYPQQLSDLWERPANAKNWGPEPYLKEYPPTDPWGNEYMYERRSGSDHVVISYGADGAPGGDAETADLDSKTINQQGEN